MYINNDEYPVEKSNSPINIDCQSNKSEESEKVDLYPKNLFFLQCIEKLSEKQQKSVKSVSQVILDMFGIKLQTKLTLKQELAKKTGSLSLAKALLSQQKVGACLTKRKVVQLKKDLFRTWSNVCLSNLQLLNCAKMCIAEDIENNNSCIFVKSVDLESDSLLLCNFYCVRGLKLELAFLREILPCLPLDGSKNTTDILKNQDVVWCHLAATILKNYPIQGNQCRELSLDQLVKALVATIRGLGSTFTPTKKFRNFALANKENKSFIANSPASYVSCLYSFYKENLLENDLWWLCLDEGAEDISLTSPEQYFVFDCIKV